MLTPTSPRPHPVVLDTGGLGTSTEGMGFSPLNTGSCPGFLSVRTLAPREAEPPGQSACICQGFTPNFWFVGIAEGGAHVDSVVMVLAQSL